VGNLRNRRASDALIGKVLRTALLGGACLAVLAPIPTAAQEAGVETVVVTGIRGSLQQSLDIKRESLGLVDAVTMEDIGHFPDSNLAAALMRIPGVTITRAATMSATTTGEATEVTVRGMGPSFNETLFNGRRIPSATGGRAFDFSGLSADMVSALEVYKSPDATLSAGAIGATINVKYPNPLDHEGLTLAASVSGKYQPNDGRVAPNGNFLFSDTFFDSKVGILVAGAYSKLNTTQYQVSNWGWIGQHVAPCQLSGYTGPDCSALPSGDVRGQNDQSKPIWFTQDLAYDYNQIAEERQNVRAAVQFQPTDALLVTLDGNFSRDSVDENQYAFAIWNNGGEMRNIKTSANGTIVDFQRFAPTDFDDNVNWGIQQTYDAGINVKYKATEHLSVMIDYDLAQSSLNPGDHWSGISEDIGYGCSKDRATCLANAATDNSTTFEVIQPGGHSLPYYKGIGPGGDAARFDDISIMGSHVDTTSASRNRNAVNQVRGELDWTEDNLTVKFGGSYITDHYHLNYWGPWESNRWQMWSGYGPDSGNPTGVHLPSQLFEGKVNLPSMPGWDSSNALPNLIRFHVADVWSYLNSLGDPFAHNIPGFNYGCCNFTNYPYTGMSAAGINSFSAGSFQQINEDTFSFYATFATETKFAGMPLKVNGGVRFEYTNVDTMGLDQPLTGLHVVPGDSTAFSYDFAPSQKTSQKNTYEYLLPNVDLRLAVTDDFQLRFDVSRTMTRPNLNDLKPNRSNWGGRVGSLGVSGGNPQELPFLSDNVDLSGEWYYAPNSYVSANAFFKSVSNFVVGGATTLILDGTNGNQLVIDPTTQTYAKFTLTQNVNGPTANVYGLEMAWQHMFGDSGFGYALNGTIVQSDKPFNPNNLTTSSFAITGLADSANIVAFYDKNGFEFRFAANWRDTYLNNFGQGQSSGTLYGAEPVFVNGVWTLDASTSYEITDNINVYLEANNLMDVAYSTRGRFSDQVLDVVSIGRSFTAGVHVKF